MSKSFQEGQPGTAAIHANPYDFVADIKDRQLFAGRRSEIAVIREELARLAVANSASPVVALVGERRVGKTSLLHRISELSAEVNVLPCIINITRVFAMSAGEFWYEVFQRLLSSANAAGVITDEDICEEVGYKPTQSGGEQTARTRAPSLGLLQWYASRSQLGDPGVPPLSMVSTDLKSLCNAIAARYCGVLLMLDEAHLLVQSLDLIQQLRHALRESSRCGIIFAGERGLNQRFTDHSAPFYLQARIIPIGNFVAKADIAECALLPLAENERPLMCPMTVDHLSRLSLGKPNQIRLICHSIYRRHLNNEQPDLNITIEALDDILDSIQASYESEYDLKQWVEMIRRLPSVDLEVLYLITRYPEWHSRDVVALDEAFRGEKTSIREAIEPVTESQAFLESLRLCQLIARRAQYYPLVIALRNLENPRESLLLEIYFETGEPLVFLLRLLTEQAEAAKILIQEFDSWFMDLPTLDEFVRGVSGHTLDEIIAQTRMFAQ